MFRGFVCHQCKPFVQKKQTYFMIIIQSGLWFIKKVP